MPKRKTIGKAKAESTKTKAEWRQGGSNEKTLGDSARLEQAPEQDTMVESKPEPEASSESESAPVKTEWQNIDPNLLAGKAMLLIDAIEEEIQQGHLPEWTAVAARLTVLVESHRKHKLQ